MSKAENPFRYFNSSPEVIRLVVLMSVRFPLSLRNVEDLLYERGIDLSYETVRYWWNRFGPMSAAEIRRKRSAQMHQVTQWRWHLDADPDPVIGALVLGVANGALFLAAPRLVPLALAHAAFFFSATWSITRLNTAAKIDTLG